MLDPVQACACKGIVARTYREMVEMGRQDEDAFRSAVNVYRIHHPEATNQDAPYVVAEWICEELAQKRAQGDRCFAL